MLNAPFFVFSEELLTARAGDESGDPERFGSTTPVRRERSHDFSSLIVGDPDGPNEHVIVTN